MMTSLNLLNNKNNKGVMNGDYQKYHVTFCDDIELDSLENEVNNVKLMRTHANSKNVCLELTEDRSVS
jgi:hypothetical protein